MLLVEDQPTTRRWLADMLGRAFPGAQVRSEPTLSGGLAAIAPFAPDFALVDLRLPDGNGVELIRRLTAQRPDCACVVCTIYDNDRYVFPALRAGADGYLLKDDPIDQQIALLQGIVEGRPPLSPAIARRILESLQAPSMGEPDPAHELTHRECEVLTIIANGYSVAEAAAALSIAATTVAGHVKNIYRKLGISSRAQACAEAVRLGLVTPGA